MDYSRETYRRSASRITVIAHLFGVTAIILLLVWLLHYREGLNIESDNPYRVFNVHPFLMFFGFIFLAGEGKKLLFLFYVLFWGATPYLEFAAATEHVAKNKGRQTTVTFCNEKSPRNSWKISLIMATRCTVLNPSDRVFGGFLKPNS
ncbi:hypothetical protein RJ640_011562 [Escallonia rubra]|uniref:Cytochrome b561 domain-containing protein n=1 Tax=Escallonia rubra TaxID=112253 RepID=A0AA88UUB8_9ASTE|nr:hypothetical protein RJ640_011562 [Escallonia rubra]